MESEKNNMPAAVLGEAEQEAVVEAVLFAMGQSVEVRQLAAALGTDEDDARKAALRLKANTARREEGCRSSSWKRLSRCAPGGSITRI